MLQELSNQLVSYKDFIQAALYTPGSGYYTRPHNPVGYNKNADFYTAQSLNTSVFSHLTLQACLTLLKSADYDQYTFVEIGSQPTNPLLGPDHPFADHIIITPGDPIHIPPKAIVFSNELLDAQPFHRLVFQDGSWQELGVRINSQNTPTEELLPQPSPEILAIIDILPSHHIEGYQLDIPLAAETLLDTIVSQNWQGLFVTFDYGHMWQTLLHERPNGTGRAYYKHELTSDILANPGYQDITCHVCWDRLFPILEKNGFNTPTLQSQESFFMHHAQGEIERIITTQPGQLDSQKQSLKELLHPSHMGQKFQVLFSTRSNK